MSHINPIFVELTLPLVKNSELIAVKTLESFGEFIGFDSSKTADCSIALVEGIINSIEHGEQKSGRIAVKFISDEPSLTIEIRDHGIGFDPKNIPVPVMETKLNSEKKRGWGLHLIKSMMDHVDINSTKNGTVLIMKKLK